MGRLDALRSIDRDSTLREEILARVSEDPAIADRLLERAPGESAPDVVARESLDGQGPALPRSVTPDRVRAALRDPAPRAFDPGLEAIILVMGRPVLLVKNDDFDLTSVATDTWTERLERARAFLRSAILSVGRVELVNNPRFDWVGTGWVVHDDIIVTNRHVAGEFAVRDGDEFVFRTSVLGQMQARLDFREEFAGVENAEFRIAEVLHIEDDGGPDMAFLRIEWLAGAAAKRPPIALARTVEPGRNVAVIGYPAKDTRTRIPDEMDRIFGNIYDVKRLAPGDLVGLMEQDRVVTHDCTTLGGNSGSVVIDLESGEARALHFAGRERDRNFAVAAPVVRARLDQLLGAGSAARVPIAPTPAAVEAAPTPEDMKGRDGFQPDFLGPTVAHPILRAELQDALAPIIGSDEGILDYTHYSVRMHRFRRLAMYTAVNIDGKQARNVPRRSDRWQLDPRLDRNFQIGNELYERNKLDRGHLVRRLDPAWGDSFDAAEAAALDTFFYTNSSPQHQILNQQLWLSLEDHILSNADVRDLRVSVFSGPVFRESDRKYRDVLIPEDFWKIVALVNDETGRLSVTGYVVSQRDLVDDLEFAFGPFQTFQVPVAKVEELTQLDFGSIREFDPLEGVETAAVRRLTTLEDIRL